MLVKKIKDVPAVPVEMEGVKDVNVRVIFGPKDEAPNFAMRVFDIAEAGHTPYHSHPFEHEVIILAGEVMVVTENDKTPLSVGDAVMVMPDEVHQFRNTSETNPASMACLVPVQYQK